MRVSEKPVRRSISLPSPVERRVKAIAKKKNVSTTRVVVDLIEAGLQAREREKRSFFDLADRLTKSSDPHEQQRLKEELARLTFG